MIKATDPKPEEETNAHTNHGSVLRKGARNNWGAVAEKLEERLSSVGVPCWKREIINNGIETLKLDAPSRVPSEEKGGKVQ